jgi:5-methylthioadenosine/S-adenosylhomocysteine deaminase
VLLISGEVVTMDPARRLITDGAVLVDSDRIIAVGPRRELVARSAGAQRLGGAAHIVLPGLVNGHQHLTGDRLIRSSIPDDISSHEAIFSWAVPVHAAHTPDDDELSATLALADAAVHGVTFTVEAGTVAHPERVLAAYDRVGVGGTLGSWGWDVDGGPWAGSVDDVLARQRASMQLAAGHPLVAGWVTLVGHDLMSDDLAVAASELARTAGTRLTFHLSPTAADPEAYLARTGHRPLVHLNRLGVLGPHVLVAHAVHVDDDEVDILVARDVAVASCPWAYVRLGQGVTGARRAIELARRGGRVALGCDSENAGDDVDVLRAAALAAGVAKDGGDPTRFGAGEALALATIEGARAVGMDGELGSLEPGKRADVVVIDASGPSWVPRAADPVLSLVWGAGTRSVRHVVAAGRVVVRDGRCTTVDVTALAAEAAGRRAHLLAAAGLGDK